MQPRKRRNKEGSESTTLLPHYIAAVLDEAIISKGSAALAVYHLMNTYDFELYQLIEIIQQKGLNISFSQVTYAAVAPYVGLDPSRDGGDMETFPVPRARISSLLFKEIIEDIAILMAQYRTPEFHPNEEPRSRCLAPIFNRIVSKFEGNMVNSPEKTIEDRIATNGRIEYHFLVVGYVTVMFIEVKYNTGTPNERFNAIAQIIAECDAGDFSNARLGFQPFPVLAILSDGDTFRFFKFDGSTSPPTFLKGTPQLDSPSNSPQLGSPDPAIVPQYLVTAKMEVDGPEVYIKSLRPICESILSFLLQAYHTGISAMEDKSKKLAQLEPRKSTPGWTLAGRHAEEALRIATAAHLEPDRVKADQLADQAMSELSKSAHSIPQSYQPKGTWNLTKWWKSGF